MPNRTANFKVSFGRRNGSRTVNEKVTPLGRIPRVTRLLALAHRINGMIRAGELKDWAEASRLIGITRARMTQIANLLLLAPELQTRILDQQERRKNSERSYRKVHSLALWKDQMNWMKGGNSFSS